MGNNLLLTVLKIYERLFFKCSQCYIISFFPLNHIPILFPPYNFIPCNESVSRPDYFFNCGNVLVYTDSATITKTQT